MPRRNGEKGLQSAIDATNSALSGLRSPVSSHVLGDLVRKKRLLV